MESFAQVFLRLYNEAARGEGKGGKGGGVQFSFMLIRHVCNFCKQVELPHTALSVAQQQHLNAK